MPMEASSSIPACLGAKIGIGKLYVDTFFFIAKDVASFGFKCNKFPRSHAPGFFVRRLLV